MVIIYNLLFKVDFFKNPLHPIILVLTCTISPTYKEFINSDEQFHRNESSYLFDILLVEPYISYNNFPAIVIVL